MPYGANRASPNEGRGLGKLLRELALPVEEKALLRELAAAYVGELEGAAPKKANLMRWTGLDEDALAEARNALAGRGLISVHPRFDGAGKPLTTLVKFNRAAIEAALAKQGMGSSEPKKEQGT
jgi:hypothetical protein